MKRIAYIDFLKAFAIATVLLGHSLSICLPVWKSCLVAPVLATAELFVCFGVVCLARRCKMTRRLFLGEK